MKSVGPHTILMAAVECLHGCEIQVSFKAKDESFEGSMWAAKPMGAVLVSVSLNQVKNRSKLCSANR